MPYCVLGCLPNLIISKTDILYYRICAQEVYEKITFVVIEARVPQITTLVGADNSAAYIYKMNYEHFIHTAAELIRKYAPKLLH